MLALEQRFFLADHNLIYTDKMSMAAGMEVRVPFLDKDLIELCANIPNKFKQRGSEGKWILKKTMEPFLPKDIIYRPKTGFGVPLRKWLKSDLKELLLDHLSVDSLNKRGLFSPQSVHKLISDNESGKIDASYTLLSILCIEIWCRAYIDK
jgi:asparagine synthase (glutamine-hydrolysing)